MKRLNIETALFKFKVIHHFYPKITAPIFAPYKNNSYFSLTITNHSLTIVRQARFNNSNIYLGKSGDPLVGKFQHCAATVKRSLIRK